MCRLSLTNPEYRKYPPLPVLRCPGYPPCRMISSLNETSNPILDRRAAARRDDGGFGRVRGGVGFGAGDGGASNPDQVVAEVGGKAITLKDVDAKWEEFDAAERARIVQATYQNRRNMLDLIVGDRLIESAAKAAGQTVAVFLEQDGAKRLPAISENDIAMFYEQNKDRAQGRTLDQLRGEIKPYLEGRRTQQARAMLVEELKVKGGAAVKVMLDPPRYTVPISATDPTRGNAAAPVTIVEFSDYQCPFCARVNPTLAKVRETYGDRVRIVFKDFPLSNHPQAPKAAEAARCAGDQSKYWEMHDAMFANQRALEYRRSSRPLEPSD